MAGFWSRLFGGAARRPTITQEASADPDKLNDVVDWFLTNEVGVRRHVSLVLHALALLGYTSSGVAPSKDQLILADGLEFRGLRNRTTFEILRRLAGVRAPNGAIHETGLNGLLQEYAASLRDSVLHLREYDTTGSELAQLLSVAEPIANEFIQTANPIEAIPAYRVRFERSVFSDERRRHLGAVFLRKNTSEIAFYVMCWLYYCWYGRQFYTAPLP
jgi:hypothetical protein